MLASVLVANRGEIALRIIATLRRLGIRAIAVHSDADADAPHVRAADIAVRIGPADPVSSYLSVDAVIAAARRTGAEGLHPGYGFLSERAELARACADAGVAFIGPPPEAIEAMGDKIRAKAAVEASGVPVLAGIHEPGLDDATLTAAAHSIGVPLLVKAAAGGGGRGMRVVRDLADLPEALTSARREAAGAFGDDALLLERWLDRSRHIEVQVLADAHGGVIALGERECSLQRRHQKVIEEAPAPHLGDDVRTAMAEAAIATARACGYVGAGTVELIVPVDDPSGFAFLEMNTRLQVEHPVTEEVWGLDLVEAQIRVASGEALDPDWGARGPIGHAVEARIYAEDPDRGFLPTGGRVAGLSWPTGAGVRVDAGIAAGSVVGSDYDPMLAKVIAAGADRTSALARLDAALGATHVLGVTTNTAFLRRVVRADDVAAGTVDTRWLERNLDDLTAATGELDTAGLRAASAALAVAAPIGADPFQRGDGWRIGGSHAPVRTVLLDAAGTDTEVRRWGAPPELHVAIGDADPVAVVVHPGADGLEVIIDGLRTTWASARDGDALWVADAAGGARSFRVQGLLGALATDEAVTDGPLVAPLPGTVAAVEVAVGESVAAGRTLVVVEAMKMEHPITAPADGTVAAVAVSIGDRVVIDQVLVRIDTEDPA